MHAAEFWDERVRMMQAWSDFLDELRGRGQVIPLRVAAKPLNIPSMSFRVVYRMPGYGTGNDQS